MQASTDNDHSDAINKIEAELGTNPSGSAATVDARFSSVESGSLHGIYAVQGTPAGTDDNTIVTAAITAAGASGEIVLPAGTFALAQVLGSTVTGKSYKVRGAGPDKTILTPSSTTSPILDVVGPGNASSDYFELDNLAVCLPADRAYDKPLISVKFQKGMIRVTPRVKFYSGDPTDTNSGTSYTGTFLKLDGAYEGAIEAEFRSRKYAVPLEFVNTTNHPTLGVPPNLDTLRVTGTVNGCVGHIFRNAYADIHGLHFERYKAVSTVFYASPPFGETTITTAANAGDMSVIVNETMVEGTMPIVGDVISIDMGDVYEVNKVTSITDLGATNQLGLAQPLRFAHSTTMPVMTGGKALSLGDKYSAITFDAFHFEGFDVGIGAGDVNGLALRSGFNNCSELVRMEGKTQKVEFGVIESWGTPNRHVWLRKATYNAEAAPDFGHQFAFIPPLPPPVLPGWYITPQVFFNSGQTYLEVRPNTIAGTSALQLIGNSNTGGNEQLSHFWRTQAGGTTTAFCTYSGIVNASALVITRKTNSTASYTILSTDPGLIAQTSTGSAVTLTLPAANSVVAGRRFTIKDESGGAGTNNITVQRAGSDTIDGATSKVISSNYGSMNLYSDGTSKWFAI